VEVVLLSKNSPETGQRVFNSIREFGLDISRAAFTSGRNPCSYIPAYNVSLFLSTSRDDVNEAISQNFPAGVILKSIVHDDENDAELRVAFDFDGVLVDDSAEKVFQQSQQLDLYFQHETQHKNEPIKPGLLKDFFQKLAFFQKLESKKAESDSSYRKILRTAIVTARNAPAHDRAINTLKSWNVEVDEMFLLGGIEKKRILEILKPHLFIDDQMGHLDKRMEDVTLVHIPFGIMNSET
jgi:5'-nucleotidase